MVKDNVVPWALEGVDLGTDSIEIGPGYGATTDVLRERVAHLTCIEVDPRLAEKLRGRHAGGNVTVVNEDATAMQRPDRAFDSAVCFTMLHHVPSAALQDRLFAEVARVLRPGGVFAGTDSRNSSVFRLLHLFDTMVVVDPESVRERLEAAGFEDVRVDVNAHAFRFRARKPL